MAGTVENFAGIRHPLKVGLLHPLVLNCISVISGLISFIKSHFKNNEIISDNGFVLLLLNTNHVVYFHSNAFRNYIV